MKLLYLNTTTKKDKDNKKLFQSTKLCAIIRCGNCNTVCCIFLNNSVGSYNSPSQRALSQLQVKLEDRYLYRGNILIDGFVIKEQHRCGVYIESQYYMSATSLQGGRITMKDVCAVYYDGNDLMKCNDIKRSERYTAGKNHYLCAKCVLTLMLSFQLVGGELVRRLVKKIKIHQRNDR